MTFHKKFFDITHRKALITGASGGIGEAVARVLHAQGAVVGLHGTRVDKLESLAQDLGDRVFIFPADLSDRQAIKKMAKEAEEKLEGVDILINNAGVTRDGLCVRMSDKAWDDLIEINLNSAFRLTREFLSSMMKNRFGRIVNITSVVGVTGNPGQANYCAAKAGIIGFSKSLARELASRNVTVNCVAPGFIETPMTHVLDDKQKDMIMGSIPMRRMGTGDDIAFSVAYLVSDEAAYITGQTLHVNGGMAMV